MRRSAGIINTPGQRGVRWPEQTGNRDTAHVADWILRSKSTSGTGFARQRAYS